jgi:hypothetical protein
VAFSTFQNSDRFFCWGSFLSPQSTALEFALKKKSFCRTYDIENINITAIMFQTGYLTLKAVDYRKNKYLLDFPNKEVRDSFLNFAVKHYANSSAKEMGYIVDNLRDALIMTDAFVYVMEFKMGKAEAAIEQIKKRKYHAPYLADEREVILVGLGFDKAERNLVDYLFEAAR